MQRLLRRCPVSLVALSLIGCGVVMLCILSACQAHVSAEGGSASTEHSREVVTPRTTTTVVEEWVIPSGGAK